MSQVADGGELPQLGGLPDAERERLLAATVGSIANAVMITEVDGTIVWVNAAFTHMSGYRPAEAIGNTPRILKSGVQSQGHYQRLWSTILSGRTWRGEVVERHKDGHHYTVVQTITPLVDDDGQPSHFVAVHDDISELTTAQELVARHAAEQAAIADLGRRALQTADLDEVGRAAEETLAWVLAAGGWQAAVVWDELTVVELFGDLGSDVIRVEVGESGAILVWDDGDSEPADPDWRFLDGVASVLSVAQQRDAARTQLEHLATHDPITGLANRTLFLDRLEHAKLAGRRTQRPFTVLFLDLDGFKMINDGFGHAIGDEMLAAVGERLRSVLRASDTVARIGGDEFAVLCPDSPNEHTATAIAARIQDALHLPLCLAAVEVGVTASIGVVLGDADRDASRLLRDADTAMYRAKADGRNRIVVFDPAMQHRARRRLQLAHRLRTALDDGHIDAHYQPIVSLPDGEPVGVEALARWPTPGGQAISPAEFIPVAEDTGLIDPLGQRILTIACNHARTWTPTAPGGFIVAVNLSPRQLARSGLADTITEVLATTGLDPTCLHLEITESAVLDESYDLATIKRLRELGVRFAIDDFGTGHSSLTNLRRLPVDVLKIDRSFVSGLTTDLQDRALVTAAIQLARAFGLTTIAEGVETTTQRDELAALGCDLAQGFLWSPPVPPSAIGPLLQATSAPPSTHPVGGLSPAGATSRRPRPRRDPASPNGRRSPRR